jgi:hypothetical protein
VLIKTGLKASVAAQKETYTTRNIESQSDEFICSQFYILARAASMELTSCDCFRGVRRFFLRDGLVAAFLTDDLPATFFKLFFLAAFLAAFFVMTDRFRNSMSASLSASYFAASVSRNQTKIHIRLRVLRLVMATPSSVGISRTWNNRFPFLVGSASRGGQLEPPDAGMLCYRRTPVACLGPNNISFFFFLRVGGVLRVLY